MREFTEDSKGGTFLGGTEFGDSERCDILGGKAEFVKEGFGNDISPEIARVYEGVAVCRSELHW